MQILINKGNDMAKMKRPRRPTRDFLDRIGIAELPPNVDVTFYDGHSDDTAFFVEKVDRKGQTVLATSVNAWQRASRPMPTIYHDLRETLVEQFGAQPVVFH